MQSAKLFSCSRTTFKLPWPVSPVHQLFDQSTTCVSRILYTSKQVFYRKWWRIRINVTSSWHLQSFFSCVSCQVSNFEMKSNRLLSNRECKWNIYCQVARKTWKVKDQRTTFFALADQDQCRCFIDSSILSMYTSAFTNQPWNNFFLSVCLASVLMNKSFICLTCHVKCVSFVIDSITSDVCSCTRGCLKSSIRVSYCRQKRRMQFDSSLWEKSFRWKLERKKEMNCFFSSFFQIPLQSG